MFFMNNNFLLFKVVFLMLPLLSLRDQSLMQIYLPFPFHNYTSCIPFNSSNYFTEAPTVAPLTNSSTPIYTNVSSPSSSLTSNPSTKVSLLHLPNVDVVAPTSMMKGMNPVAEAFNCFL